MMNDDSKIPSLLHQGSQFGRAILKEDLGMGIEKKFWSIENECLLTLYINGTFITRGE